MADSKISALPASTTPLAGTEVLPIVQGGQTRQVTVSDLTAGRAVSALSLTLTNALTAANGGTGQSSYTVGDLLYASTTTALSKLADVATGNALISGGVGVAPSWGKIDLTTHVSGTLPVGNGGTGITSLTAGYIPYGNGTSAFSSGTGLTYSSATLTVQSTANIGGGGTDGVIGITRASGATLATMTWITATDQFQFNNNNGGIYTWRNNGTEQWRLDATGNLIPKIAAKGINFTANSAAAGMTSQLLNYYEEGTWTPTVKVNNTGSAIGITLYEGTYTRVGRLVFAEFRIARNDASALSGTVTWSLPISSGNSTYFVSGSWWNASTNISGTVDINNYAASIANGGIAAGGYLTYANFANGDNLCVSMIYQA